MQEWVIIYLSSVHMNIGRAKLAVATVAVQLGVEVDCRLMSVWRVWIDSTDKKTFLELAREEAKNDKS